LGPGLGPVRLLTVTASSKLGHGGIRLAARAAGVREATVSLGVSELDSGAEPLGRARRPGGGRKRRLIWIRGWARVNEDLFGIASSIPSSAPTRFSATSS
jgi:hypothetical protein